MLFSVSGRIYRKQKKKSIFSSSLRFRLKYNYLTHELKIKIQLLKRYTTLQG